MKHFLVFIALCSPLCAQAERPNILFLFSDDHALKAISSYGGPLKDLAPTPNIDRIAHEGVLFKNSFCANSICGPSRACIITGKHSHKNGYLSNDFDTFDGNQSTLPKLLQASGYQTAIIGKWHLVSQPQGFDFWNIVPNQGNYYNPDFIGPEGKKRINGYVTDIITDQSIAWLKDQRDKNKPFLLMCQHKAPHRNWSPAPRHLGLFQNKKFPLPETLYDNYDNRSSTLKNQQMSIKNHMSWGLDMKFHGPNLFPQFFSNSGENPEYARMDSAQKKQWDAAYDEENSAFIADMKAGKLNENQVTAWKYQRYLRDYLACVRAVDESVGRMLDYLAESGLAKNTIVIYAADQGFYLGEHGWYDKRWMFEPSLAMPFMMRWPGVIKAESRPTAMIQNIDYAPTLLEATKQPIPADMQGKSFLPVLKDANAALRDAIYYAYYGENTHHVPAHDGVRTKTHKLIHFSATNEWNLFDLSADPHEMKSLHDDPAQKELLDKMKGIYGNLRKQYEVNDATVPSMRLKEKWWAERHQQSLAQLKKEKRPDIVFLGDSITQGWEGAGKDAFTKYFSDYKTLNLGFSGDRTQHVLWRLFNGEYDQLQPKAVVLLIGTNNTGHVKQDSAETAQGIHAIVDFIRSRSPSTKILLHTVFPRGATKDDEMRKINTEVNRLCAPLADDKFIFLVDLAPKFLQPDGTLSKATMPDLLHLNAASYDAWGQTLAEKLKQLGL